MKRAQPYLPLYVQDVLTDPHLCACSASACGVYLYLLCVLHKQEAKKQTNKKVLLQLLLQQKYKQTLKMKLKVNMKVILKINKGVQGEKGEKNRFEEMWQVYPRKVEKAAARKAYEARLHDGWSPDELYAAAKESAALCRKEKREQRYIKHAAVFFGASTPFADYLPRGTSEEEEEDDLKDCF